MVVGLGASLLGRGSGSGSQPATQAGAGRPSQQAEGGQPSASQPPAKRPKVQPTGQAAQPGQAAEGNLCGMCAYNLNRWVVKTSAVHKGPDGKCPASGMEPVPKYNKKTNRKFNIKEWLAENDVFGPN